MTNSIDLSQTNLDSILESIHQIRLEGVNDKVNKRITIPVRYFGTLLHRFEADSISIFLFTNDGNVQKYRTLGNHNNLLGSKPTESLNEFVKWMEQQRDKPTVFISDLSNPQRKQDGLSPIFGYCCFYKKAKFSTSERLVLSEIPYFAGDFITDAARIFTLRQITSLQNELLAIVDSKQKTGTKLVYSMKKIDQCLGSSYSYFCTISKENCYPEYINKPSYHFSPKVADSINTFKFNSSFLDICMKNETFKWPKNSPVFPLEKYLPLNQLYRDTIDYFYFIAPIIRDGVLIGVYISALNKTNLWFDSLTATNLLQFYKKVMQEPIKFLFQRRVNAMIVDPVFRGRKSIVDDKKIFILMPFTEPWSDRIWNKIIKTNCVDLGFDPIRADDLFGRDIIEDIWEGICTSRFVIADITGRNPNVFYELGIAHTLGKEVILLTQSIKDIPFDLNRYRHIIYQDNMDGYDLLKSELIATIQTITR